MTTRGSAEAGNIRSQSTPGGSSVGDLAREAAEQVTERASEYAEVARDYGREAGHAVTDVASNFRQALDRSIERQPITTVLLAMAAGVILGGMMRR